MDIYCWFFWDLCGFNLWSKISDRFQIPVACLTNECGNHCFLSWPTGSYQQYQEQHRRRGRPGGRPGGRRGWHGKQQCISSQQNRASHTAKQSNSNFYPMFCGRTALVCYCQCLVKIFSDVSNFVLGIFHTHRTSTWVSRPYQVCTFTCIATIAYPFFPFCMQI